MDNHPRERTVYYDDSCELCEGAAEKIRTDIDLDTVGASGELPEGVSKEALMYEVHAMDENGVMHKGIDAVILIVRWHPRWNWVAPVLALPGIKHAGAVVYRVVAANRHRFYRRKD